MVTYWLESSRFFIKEWISNCFIIFIRIRAHRGQFLNEKADRWADEGRDDVGNVQWDGSSSYPTCLWTDAGVEHRCSMDKTLWARVHLNIRNCNFLFIKTLHLNFLTKKTTAGIFWRNNGKTRLFRTGPKDA